MAHTRRTFLGNSAKLAAFATTSSAFPSCVSAPILPKLADFEISLAQWSLHRTFGAGDLDNLDFAKMARSFDINAIEYVNRFFYDKALDDKYIAQMKQRADDMGVQSLLIMCDGEGNLGDPSATQREIAVQKHRQWLRAAKQLGCHSIRVNAASSGSFEEQQKLAADGLAKLADYGAEYGLNVIVENHGGYSSNGNWLAGVMKRVGKDNCGTLPDFGNFNMYNGNDVQDGLYDRYQGVEEMMPFAKAVSAKSHAFDENGDETGTDYYRMVELVLRSGYTGHFGVEYEGGKHSEDDGIRLTRDLLKKVRGELTEIYPLEPWQDLFNGKDLSNWQKVNCHDETFTVEDNMIKCDGIPTGVLRSEKRYRNFICEFEYKHIEDVSNAGFFIWSDPTPAIGVPFTRAIEVQVINGYETDTYTSHGDIFAIWGATLKPVRPHPTGAERCLPSQRRARGTGEWNHFRITAVDGTLTLSVNGKVVSAGTEINPREGFLCIEAEGTTVYFKNMRVRELPSSGRLAPEQKAERLRRDHSLYNGRDLTGWTTPSKNNGWKANGPSLVADTGATPLRYALEPKIDSVSIDWQPIGGSMTRTRIKRGEELENFSFVRGALTLHPTSKVNFMNLFSRY